MYRLGLLIYPIALALLVWNQRGVVDRFRKAGAVTPGTARRPSSLGIDRHWEVRDAVRSGGLVAVGDGRYYADAVRCRRKQRAFAGLVILLTGVTAAVTVVLWLCST